MSAAGIHDAVDRMAAARTRIRSIGRTISLPIFAELKSLYAPLQNRITAAVQRDLAYGPHPRHRLNVFSPSSGVTHTGDVLLFVHGGGFVSGDKDEMPGAFYDNIGLWAASHGMSAITMNYRLAPDHKWPAGAEDVTAAFDWVLKNIGSFGGDPQRVFVVGHSAGAAHVAGFISRSDRASSVAGAICISGLYDLSVDPVNTAYFGEDRTLYPERSPLPALARTDTRLLVLSAEYDPSFIQQHTIRLLDARLVAKQSLPAFAQVRGHNHFSSVLHLNSPDASLGNEILAFVRSQA